MDRRNFIAGAALLPAACAAPALAGPTSLDEAGLAECLTRFRAARETANCFHEDVWRPLSARWEAAKAAVPHYTTKASHPRQDGSHRHLTTADDAAVAAAKYFCARHGEPIDDYGRCAKELVEGLRSREQQIADLKREYRIAENLDRMNELDNIATDILVEIETYPVQTPAGLLRKLELIEEHDCEITLDVMLADARRIASAGRA